MGAFRPQFRSLNRRKSASCGHCLFRMISPPMRFPPQAVIGGSSCARGVTPLDPAPDEITCMDIPNKRRLPLGGTKVSSFWPKKAAFSGRARSTRLQALLSVPKQQREPSCLYTSSIIRRSGSREVTSLVGCGVKPRVVPLYKSQAAIHACVLSKTDKAVVRRPKKWYNAFGQYVRKITAKHAASMNFESTPGTKGKPVR